MGTYHQLTEYQRYQIYALKKAGHDQQCIAATVAVSPSTISSCGAIKGNAAIVPAKPITKRWHVVEGDQDDGRGSSASKRVCVSSVQRISSAGGYRRSSIESAAHLPAHSGGSVRCIAICVTVRRNARNDGKADARGQIKDRVSNQRPAIVEEKSRIGDWEIDLVMGRPRTGALVSVVERRSRYTVLGKVPSKQAEHVAAATIALLAAHKGHTQTITADNGSSAKRWTRPYILPIPTMLGSADSTRTPTG